METICDVSIAMDASPEYGLNPREAAAVLKEVQAAVRDWRGKATQLNASKAEQDLMADAFQG